MIGVECRAVAEEGAVGWRAYRADLTAEAETEDQSTADVPAVVVYCSACAEREFGDG
jgi:hypothetical protein